jgi:hypothetical protein
MAKRFAPPAVIWSKRAPARPAAPLAVQAKGPAPPVARAPRLTRIVQRMDASSPATPTSASSSADQTTVGSSTIVVKWTSSKEGTLDCFRKVWSQTRGEHVKTLGDVDFRICALGEWATWDWLAPAKPNLDASALCVVLNHIENDVRHIAGTGAACVHMLASIAEQKHIDHIIVWSSVPEAIGFYEKTGFATFSSKCDDMYGKTSAVKQNS